MSHVVIATRAMHEDLCAVSHEMLNLPYQKHMLFGTSAAGYLYKLLELDAEWVINIDEDAFVWDSERIEELRAFMEREGYACCGMPDGGVVPIRQNNPVVPNTFFNVINTKRLKSMYWTTWQIKIARFGKSLRRHTPPFAKEGAYAYHKSEPYYPFFLWMLKKGLRILYLNAHVWPSDNKSTILHDHLGRDFLIHTWYARSWREHGAARIKKAFGYCLDRVRDRPGLLDSSSVLREVLSNSR